MIDLDKPLFLPPLIALYPEIHYRFRAFPISRYFRREPEIIVDAPHRLEPGSALPILLLIKDADSFPVTVDSVQVEARTNNQLLSQVLPINREVVKRRWWHHIEWIDLPDESPCIWEVDVTWNLERKGRSQRIRNSNLPLLVDIPLKVKQSGHSLPGEAGWFFGDLHAHTAYTEDQVEFGAPLSAYPALGSAAGLSFCMAADHAYDLDDLPDSFHEPDPMLTRFNYRDAQINRLNTKHAGQFCILHGFELSVGNARDKNVHLLLIDQREFLSGSGDSAERWLQTRPELSIGQALRQKGADALAIAAHPKDRPPLLQQFFLRRGHWESQDLIHEELSGLQIWNGNDGKELREGLETWKKGLLAGKSWKVFAGSDAHGNFNHHLKVSTPMVRLSRLEEQRFGEVRTGLFTAESPSSDAILSSLRQGQSLITDGPFGKIEQQHGHDGSNLLLITAQSSPEFGELSTVKLYWGKTGEPAEQLLWEEAFGSVYQTEYRLDSGKKTGYCRLEVLTKSGKRAYTNPIKLTGLSP